MLRALEHPRVTAMAHPTGRLIGGREPALFDMDQVTARAAELGVAMEINSQPDRMDLKDSHARRACERGVRMVIDTDSHSTTQLEFIRYGVFIARRAGLTRDDVLNTLPYEQFMAERRRPRPTSTVASGPARAPAEKVAPARLRPAQKPPRAPKSKPSPKPSKQPAAPLRGKKAPARGKER